MYLFSLPDENSHQYHNIGLTAAVTEIVDPKVRLKIKELVHQGKRNISIITALLEQYVINELGETDRLRRRFYPERKCIRNIVNAVKQEIRWSKIDLENVEQLVKGLKDKSDFTYFRPCTQKQNSGTTQKENSEENQTLLFVYQSSRMKDLYLRYGKDGILLDATYKTCKWALPLYFIAAKTNVGYQPVAVFITQYETKQAIFEALSTVKEWNPQIIPKFAMVDFAMEEILSLEATFPTIKVFICSFHREQAWTRWLSKSTSSCLPRGETLKYLRAIANAPNEDKVEKAIADIKEWRYYQDSPLQIYCERTWLPEIKRWAQAYKPPGLMFHSNNGLERINEELKYRYLMENKNCSLSEMISVLVNNFLPDRFRWYVNNNIRMMSSYKKYADNIPHFLHNRPKWVIDLVMEKWDLMNSEDLDNVIIKKLTETSYEVSSVTSSNVTYKVNCKDSVYCTCPAFGKSKFFCKHLILLAKKFPNFDIGAMVLKNEVFIIDESVINLSIPTTDIPHTSTDSIDESVSNNLFCPKQEYEKNEPQKSRKKKLICNANSIIRSLQSAMWLMEEEELGELNNELQLLYEKRASHIIVDQDTGLITASATTSKMETKAAY